MRLLDAYQESLLALDELRTRMPMLRKREATLQAQLEALEAELHDAETHLELVDSLEGFLARLAESADSLSIAERQRPAPRRARGARRRRRRHRHDQTLDTEPERPSRPVTSCVGAVMTPPAGRR
jgi:septal ring factor EnvC (AmiA/AmiB activator)